MTLHRESALQIRHTYAHMAEMGYRPAAPSDGFGNITEPLDSLDIDREAMDYAKAWATSEDELNYWIGCPHFEYRPALIYAVEAARVICGIGAITREGRTVAIDLLRAALLELEHPDDPDYSARRECECGGQEFNYVAGIESVDRWAARIDERLNDLLKAINKAGRPN